MLVLFVICSYHEGAIMGKNKTTLFLQLVFQNKMSDIRKALGASTQNPIVQFDQSEIFWHD